nr:helicase-related protein [Spirochaetota bacterium]
ALERLVLLSGEFQRIALSATVRPLERVASAIAGFFPSTRNISGPDSLSPRPIRIIEAAGERNERRIELTVASPLATPSESDREIWWQSMAAACREEILQHRSTLCFCNSRRFTEKLARYINEGRQESLAWAHHGSLARELRLVVEERMKAGQLKAIVSTNTLELGIDIGQLDQVLLVQTPRQVSSALQRIGRSGHGVGETSRAILFPLPGIDLAEAACMAHAVHNRDIEEIRIPESPLDILSQILLSMVVSRDWTADGLYTAILACWPYRNLPRRHFDLVLDLLAGRYAITKVSELSPRISIDPLDGRLKAKPGAARLLYLSGGTIPDRGLFDLRVDGSNAKIGELDEEFVWERSPGDTFALGSQVWRIQSISENAVSVRQVHEPPGIIPFWKQENLPRDWHFSERLGIFMNLLETTPPNRMEEILMQDYAMRPEAARELVNLVARQKERTGCALPHRNHILIEHSRESTGPAGSTSVLLHTLWGSQINQPFALALSAAWKRLHGWRLETFVNNDGIALLVPHDIEATFFSLVTPENLESLLRESLETSGFFGALFRENAGRALLLPKGSFNKRIPLWVTRLRSKKLLDAVCNKPDFPLMLETWRSCLADEFDLPALHQLLDEIAAGTIRISECHTTTPSPFAEGILWRLTNRFMYEDDTTDQDKPSSLTAELYRQLVNTPHLRPLIPQGVILTLLGKLQRTAPGYAPAGREELIEHVFERLLVPEDEWLALVENCNSNSVLVNNLPFCQAAADRLARLTLPQASVSAIVALENLPLISRLFGFGLDEACLDAVVENGPSPGELAELAKKIARRAARRGQDASRDEPNLAEFLRLWLSTSGPLSMERIESILGSGNGLSEALASLARDSAIIIDQIRGDSAETEVCESGVLEKLLRMMRRARQTLVRPLPARSIPLFLANWQGLLTRGSRLEDLEERLGHLFGYPSEARAWEDWLIPARMTGSFQSWLDTLFAESDLLWFGCGKQKISLALAGELDRILPAPTDREAIGTCARLFRDPLARYEFFELAASSGLPSDTLAGTLWDLAWKGCVTTDSFAALRQAIANDFALPSNASLALLPRGQARARWNRTRPQTGVWAVLHKQTERESDAPASALESDESVRDRVRILLDRYGILFREILQHELPLSSWAQVFRSLRLMELSGEIESGQFFENVSGLQFASPLAIQQLRLPLPEDAVWWCNACDPVAPSSWRLDSWTTHRSRLPERRSSTWLSFCGSALVVVAKKHGREVEISLPQDDPSIGAHLTLFHDLLARENTRQRSFLVERINGQAASVSPWRNVFVSCGFVHTYKGLELRRRVGI